MPRDAATARAAADNVAQLIELELKKIETLRELRRALLLMAIVPNIFDMGKVRTQVIGKMAYSTIFGDTPTSETLFVLIPEKGEQVEVPLFDVPMELWPDKMAENLKRRSPLTYTRLTRHEGD